MTRFDRVKHLSARFFASVRARELDDADIAWVRLVLTPEELAVWNTLGRADRAESVAVARAFTRERGADAESEYIAAALLHDVGKTDAHLGAIGRSGATVIAGVVSHGRARGFPNRIGRYVAHDDLGAARLEAAGARRESVAWARVHHRPQRWGETAIPADICAALARADGEKVNSVT
jgi:hypothetical protein